MPQLFLNNFQTQFIASVKAAPDSASPALELDYGVLRVSDGAAGLLLNPGAGNWYVLTAFKRSGSAESDYEVLHVTGVDNAVLGECRLTVLRGQEGTTPKSYVAGDIVEMRLTAGGMGQYVQTADARLSNPRAPTGAAGGVLSGSYPNPGFAQAMATTADLSGKVDKVAGKGLSANDYTNADMAKLNGVAEQATKNATDAQLRDRASHSGAQAIATVTGLQEALDLKEAAGAVTAHAAAPDPHPQYTTQARASAAAPVQSVAGRTGAVVIDKADVGLGSLDNTSDASKPVSTAQQAALNLKAPLASPVFTGTPTAPTAVSTVNTTQIATTAFVQAAISAAGSPVTSVGGQTGVVLLKTINGLPLTGTGNIEAGASLYRVARTDNTQLAAADKGKLIDITAGTWTQTFAAVAALGDGWYCYLRNSGTGDITIPASDERTNWIMYPGEVRLFQCDGAALRSIVLRAFYSVVTSSRAFIKPPGYLAFEGLLWGGGCSGSGGVPIVSPGGPCERIFIPFAGLSESTPVVIGAGGLGITYFSGSTAGNPGGVSSFGDISTYGIVWNSWPRWETALGASFQTYDGRTQTSGVTAGGLAGGPGGLAGGLGTKTLNGGRGGSGRTAAGAAAQNGEAPGGAGGNTDTAGTQSGAGARGEMRIWGII